MAATDDLRLVGDVALRAGLPIYELRKAGTDLEALFFELTEGTNRNLGDAAGQAPAEPDAVEGREGGERVMRGAITSEIRKIFTTRLWWGMALGMASWRRPHRPRLRRARRQRLRRRPRRTGPTPSRA